MEGKMRRVTTVETYEWDNKSDEWVKKSKTVTDITEQPVSPVTVQPYVYPYAPRTWPYPYVTWSATGSSSDCITSVTYN